jgi:hypothetical protein
MAQAVYLRKRLPLLVGPLNHVLTAYAAATDPGALPKARLREELLPQHRTQRPPVDLKCRRDAGETERERRPAADVIRKSVGEFDSLCDGQSPRRGHVTAVTSKVDAESPKPRSEALRWA